MEKNLQKNEKPTQTSLSIDGARLKNIREAKQLTQLYVANVVGVTTDTISRWENNRYPSIKRDNALKLCSALGVELPEILRQEEAPTPVPEVPEPAAPARRAPRVALLLCLLVLLLFGGYLLFRLLFTPPTAVRWIPHYASPGEVIPVQIKIHRPESDGKGFILKERLPPGWKMVSALPPASLSEAHPSQLKWLIPWGKGAVTVLYTAQVPADARAGSESALDGEVVLNTGGSNRTEAITGDTRVRIGPYHWADSNGDKRIDDDEIMPAYYICEDMKGLGLDWKTIEAIWSARGYRWDPREGYVAIK